MSGDGTELLRLGDSQDTVLVRATVRATLGTFWATVGVEQARA
jgi:hypothetical protein